MFIIVVNFLKLYPQLILAKFLIASQLLHTDGL